MAAQFPDYTNRLGYYVSITLAVLTLFTFVIAFLTPPISGPNCTDPCIEYPYLDIESRFPRDYWWMIPATVLTAVFVVLLVCIHQYAAPEKKVFSQIGLSFGLMAAVILIVDYFVQLSVIQPSIDNGETEGIPLLTQYNSHGLFIVLEEIGYLLMSVAFLFIAPVFSGPDRVEKALRWIFAASFFLVLAALIVLSITKGIDRRDTFEIISLSVDWTVLIITGVLLSRVFRRAMSGG
jgi:hypothetical protein